MCNRVWMMLVLLLVRVRRLARLVVVLRCSRLGGVRGRSAWIYRRPEVGRIVGARAIRIGARGGNVKVVGTRHGWFHRFSVRISIAVRFVGARAGRALPSAATKRTSAFVH